MTANHGRTASGTNGHANPNGSGRVLGQNFAPNNRQYNGIQVALWLAQLTPQTTLGGLPLHNFRMHPATPGHIVARRLQEDASLPGVIIAPGDAGKLFGMISRPKFIEYLSCHPQADKHLHHPIGELLKVLEAAEVVFCLAKHILILPHSLDINEAIAQAISRPLDAICDPIVVNGEDGIPRLLGFHDLTLAQAHINELERRSLTQREKQLGKCRLKILQEWEESKKFSQSVENREQLLHHREQFLERQREEVLFQSEQVAQMKQRFEKIERLFSEEGTAILQAFLGATQVISSRTNRTNTITKALLKELDTLRKISRLIKQLSKQVQFLGFRSAILTNRFGSEFNGLGQFTEDIRQLSQQSLTSSQNIEERIHLLRYYLDDLMNLSHEGTDALQNSVQQTARLEEMLVSVGELLQNDDSPAPRSPATLTWINPRFRGYVRVMEEAESG